MYVAVHSFCFDFRHSGILHNGTKLTPRSSSQDSQDGVYNFRSILRRTNYDPENVKTKSQEEVDPSQVDFRKTLKKIESY